MRIIITLFFLKFLARLHVKIHGVYGAIAKTTSHNQITPTTINIHVGLREKQTKTYTISSGWNNESFSFDLTFHEHLFWNLQVKKVALISKPLFTL